MVAENIDTAVHYGTVSGAAIESLLRRMNSLYMPTFLNNKLWPESFKKEFSGQLNKFMASLTETTYNIKGHTVLFVPTEELSNLEAAAKQKDLVQRLESTLIHWTRQVPILHTRACEHALRGASHLSC